MRELCPSLIVSSIVGSLIKLVLEGEIRREGVGMDIKDIAVVKLNLG